MAIHVISLWKSICCIATYLCNRGITLISKFTLELESETRKKARNCKGR